MEQNKYQQDGKRGWNVKAYQTAFTLLPAKWTVERNDIKVSETVTK